jgi:cytidine deaminase
MVAVGNEARGVIAPCGRCRQTLLDLHPDCFVVVPAAEGPDCRPIHELLPFAYRYPGAAAERFVRFNSAYFERIRSGVKTATTRYRDPVEIGPALFIFEDDDGYRRLDGVIDDVEMLRFDELTAEHAELEGASSLEALRTGLRHHYPHLVDDACISVVRFHLVAACPS